MPVPARRIASAVESWFERHQRPLPWRESYDPYHVWVSEVMLQQTRMEVVLRHYPSFLGRFPTLVALAGAEEQEVLAAWSGLGYYRRARMLHAGAREVVERFGGMVPDEVEPLLSIPGIGRYTAGAIASIVYRRRAAVVDGNVARIVARLAAIAEPAGSSRLMRAAWIEAERLAGVSRDPRLFNQGLMEIGALICTPRKPACGRCPVRRHCAAFAAGRTGSLPAPKEKRTARKVVVPLYWIEDGRGRILMRRERGPLMTAMFHLPHGSTELLPGSPLRVTPGDLLGTFRHTITTRNVEFRLHAADLASSVGDNGDYAWIDPAELGRVPHPSYVAKAMTARIASCAGG
ncbi:MAG TPA: A/G-specific adenine glycosylase [Thermoanaerobaculia bacterium]|nr:A/G-specific adenine glycosylase [Thermoanaerobaculia bacterium]